MAMILPIGRQEIARILAEAAESGEASIAFLSPDGEVVCDQPAGTCFGHDSNEFGGAADCIHALPPMAYALSPTNPTLSWVCLHGIEFIVNALFCQSTLVGIIIGHSQSTRPVQHVTRLIRSHFQDLIDAQGEMENLSMEIARNYEELNLHYELSAKLGAHPSAIPVYQSVVDQIRRLIVFDHIAILVPDDRGGLKTAYAADRHGKMLEPFRLPPGEGISGEVLRTGSASIVCRVEQSPHFVKRPYPMTTLLSVPMITSGKVLGVINLSDKKGGKEFSTNELKLLEAIARQAAIALENARLFAEVRELFLSAVKTLASAIDAKDPYTHGHSLRVAQYATVIARQLGLTEEQCEEIYLAAVLHDVGKIAVPESILLKQGGLTEDEWKEMRQHPLHSAKILSQVRHFGAIAKAVRHEHERYDGSGYPDKLHGEEIPLASRIIALADAYDAMTTTRSYRKGMPAEETIELLAKAVGSQFDPKVFESFKIAYQRGQLTPPDDASNTFLVT